MMEAPSIHDQHIYSDRTIYSESGRTKKSIIAPFLKNLYIILQNEDPAIIGWVDDGMAFEVRDMDKMSLVILPKYFRHSKFASFQRQLNYFGFKKLTKSHTQVCTYSRTYFSRDNVNGLLLIKRKTHNILGKPRSNSMCSVSSYSSNKSCYDIMEDGDLSTKTGDSMANTDPIPVTNINDALPSSLTQCENYLTHNGLFLSRNNSHHHASLQLLVEAEKSLGPFHDDEMGADLDVIFNNAEDLVHELGGEKLGDSLDLKQFFPIIQDPSPCVAYTPALQSGTFNDWDLSLPTNNDSSWTNIE